MLDKYVAWKHEVTLQQEARSVAHRPEISAEWFNPFEAPILWPPDAKSWFTGEDLDAGKDWGQKKRVAEDEMLR